MSGFQCVMKDGETIKELKANLKKANIELKERSLLLDMYKTVTKETRDKVGLMAAEKKARGELDEARYEEFGFCWWDETDKYYFVVQTAAEENVRDQEGGEEETGGRGRGQED